MSRGLGDVYKRQGFTERYHTLVSLYNFHKGGNRTTFARSYSVAVFGPVKRLVAPQLYQRPLQIGQSIFAKEHLAADKQRWCAKDPAIDGVLRGRD